MACTPLIVLYLLYVSYIFKIGAVYRAEMLLLLCTQYAFNLFSHNSPMTGNGYNEEEMKMVKETHKIWGEPNIAITATCIRVPIMRAHAESINLEFEREVSEEEVRALFLCESEICASCVRMHDSACACEVNLKFQRNS